MRLCLTALIVLLAGGVSPSHAELSREGAYVRDCLLAASRAHNVPPVLLVLLLRVEGGRLGAVSQNTNDTVDIGPMQVNSTWVHKIAQRWQATDAVTYRALRDNFCANVEAGAWILQAGLVEAHGDFWEGVAYYHSHTPEHKQRYLRQIWKQVLSLNPNPSAPRPAPDSIVSATPTREAAR